MKKSLTLHIETIFDSSISIVWNALVNPELIKKYFFGTDAISDWKKGSPLIFRGSWEGKSYEDKATILEIEPDKLLKYSYWSSMSGTPDLPENYAEIAYMLSQQNGKTVMTISQGGIASEESKKHSETNWRMVMDNLKKVLGE